MATLPTTDMEAARAFYEGVLGFTPGGDAPEGENYSAAGSTFLVYPSAFAGTNQATAISFRVDFDTFDDEIAALREKGIVFDTFEYEGIVWEDGVATMEGMKAVWFHDPDGNILSVEMSSD
jgi:catechol 2,3-dioxygenase-like lactoylglutathione lyase family enzyme